MGFRDDIRRLKYIQRANPHMSAREIQDALDVEKQEASDPQYARYFAQTDVAPYVESLSPKAWKGGKLCSTRLIRLVAAEWAEAR
jgi:hypothetical protein